MLLRGFLVRAKGLEPPHLAAPDPKSGTSTNFATPAYSVCNYQFAITNADTIDNQISKYLLGCKGSEFFLLCQSKKEKYFYCSVFLQINLFIKALILT